MFLKARIQVCFKYTLRKYPEIW